jgi:RNA polymerase sigma-70 factor (ECF subfamily)
MGAERGDLAERELARQFAPRIRLYGLRHLGSEDQARELVQEVLVIVIEALRAGRVEQPERIDRFMLGTCRNVVNGWRRGERRKHAATALVAAAEPDACLQPPPRAETPRLLGCMAGLSPRERSVLVMSYCEEQSADEIASVLELSPGNVRVLRHRALARVKGCLEGAR